MLYQENGQLLDNVVQHTCIIQEKAKEIYKILISKGYTEIEI